MVWAQPPIAAKTFVQGFGEAEALWRVTGGLVRSDVVLDWRDAPTAS
jgi:hypothetical protein